MAMHLRYLVELQRPDGGSGQDPSAFRAGPVERKQVYVAHRKTRTSSIKNEGLHPE